MTDKEQQLCISLDTLQIAEKQILELTEELACRDLNHNQGIESLNNLLREAEETAQQQIDQLAAAQLKAQQGKTTAEYATAEVRTELE